MFMTNRHEKTPALKTEDVFGPYSQWPKRRRKTTAIIVGLTGLAAIIVHCGLPLIA
ncbi:hypothetical protein [Candidatus Rhodobacter oscarellae]|uniref:hypothetical protein n=1 Tax=Candidatus Rhodobacter oscarellae TaxID=1675527 RepID=UPI000A4DAD2B|nr:hypothetical protein [Candidatus Rhodobacter lobularis]